MKTNSYTFITRTTNLSKLENFRFFIVYLALTITIALVTVALVIMQSYILAFFATIITFCLLVELIGTWTSEVSSTLKNYFIKNKYLLKIVLEIIAIVILTALFLAHFFNLTNNL